MIIQEYLQQYNNFINNIINSRGQWSDEVKSSERGCERHHILARCLGGLPKTNTWAKHENIIWLYPSEHFELHKLLVLAYPDNIKLKQAFIMMSVVVPNGNRDENIIISAETYEYLRQLRHEVLKVDNPTFNETVRKKISLTRIGTHLSQGTKQKLSEAHKGKQKSPEHRQKLSLSNKGKHFGSLSAETKQKISIALKNRKFSEDHKNKIKQQLMGKPKSASHRLHLSESKIKSGVAKGKNNPRATAVQCIETGQIFNTISEACLWAHSLKVGEVCHGHRATAGGYHWKFIEKNK